MPLRQPRRAGLLLATGQTTQYSSELDDGNYEKGLAKRYEILTTGAYSGNTNIDLAHYTGGAGAIAFDNVAKTITDTGNGLAIFKTNDVITTNASNNPGPFTVTTGNVAGTITCTGATFVTETPAGAITISKREAKANACVLDLNTGLMWIRRQSLNMGSASNGFMPWTGQLYDIFAYAAAANTASLAGYGDWRVPNLFELISLTKNAVGFGTNRDRPDDTAFPTWTNDEATWSSTTYSPDTNSAYGWFVETSDASLSQAKTTALPVLLVRGG